MTRIESPTASTAASDIERAVDRLRSLHDGEAAIGDVVSCGRAAIPALRKLLFQREPSGIFEVRCRAVAALARLRADAVLIEFLSTSRDISDAVERLGEDAVINAAALALTDRAPTDRDDPRMFPLLLELARRPSLTGVISALARLGRPAAIPALIEALADDGSRAAAETGLKAIGRAARPALIRAASERPAMPERESDSSRRRRRSALRVLTAIGLSKKLWPSLRHLTQDAHADIAIAACALGLKYASSAERIELVHCLIRLVQQVDWPLRDEIENHLVARYDAARDVIAEALRGDDAAIRDPARRVLLRVQTRAAHPP